LTHLLSLFANNILPIFLAAGAGYLLTKYKNLNPRTVSRIAFYILSPCLVFTLLTSNQINAQEALRVVGCTVAVVISVGLLVWVIGRLIGLSRRTLAAVLITAMFCNAGNYGLSVTLFAFGESALTYASLVFVTTAALTYSLGVIIASMGATSLKTALVGLFKVPPLYAILAAVVAIAFDLELPLPLERTVGLLSSAAIPVLMVLLGIQLYHAKWNGDFRSLVLSNTMRLVAAPLLAVGFAVLFGLYGTARQAMITEAAMPTAVVTTVLAIEYDVDPSFVTSAVFSSTLLSPITLTPLLALLGA
jgi:predicted permease